MTDWHERMSETLKAFADCHVTSTGAWARQGERVFTLAFFNVKGELYAILWLDRQDGHGHALEHDYERCDAPEDVRKTLKKWSEEYGFDCGYDKQIRLF